MWLKPFNDLMSNFVGMWRKKKNQAWGTGSCAVRKTREVSRENDYAGDSDQKLNAED